jgi:alpha,alpha-trehalase
MLMQNSSPGCENAQTLAPHIVHRKAILGRRGIGDDETMPEKYSECLSFIDSHWEKLTFRLPQDTGVWVGLPNPYVAPTATDGIFAYDQYYWDSYFIILGLLAAGKIELARGMVDNFLYLFKRFGIIPSRNRFFDLGISQPPFLTSMIRELWPHVHDPLWLKDALEVAEQELQTRWLDGSHRVYHGLSRYLDHYRISETSEFESGWDRTSRFRNVCVDVLPVDLNSCLYKYEVDLAELFALLGDTERQTRYAQAAEERRQIIRELMYNRQQKFYFDYNYAQHKRHTFYSLAGFFPLWANIATTEEAEGALHALTRFEYDGGLATTQRTQLFKPARQWDYPNGWPNLHWIVVRGLLNYGFRKDAERIAEKWLNTNLKVFHKTRRMWEKYDVVGNDMGHSKRYPIQEGFAWTNAVFLKLCTEFGLQ